MNARIQPDAPGVPPHGDAGPEGDLQASIAFYLTGRRAAAGIEPIDGLRPALFAGVRDLTRLRHDYPLVLVPDAAGGAFAQPLSALIDALADEIARKGEGDAMRSHLLRAEMTIRAAVARGAQGTLAQQWDALVKPLGEADPAVGRSLAIARAALKTDGELIGCDAATPARVVSHAWRTEQERKARRFRADITRLALRLEDILRADFAHSEAGRSAAQLRLAVGATEAGAFDFEAMSRMLARATPKTTLAPARRARIEALLAGLRAQRFFAVDGPAGGTTEPAYAFTFDSCGAALAAFRERMPDAVRLARSIAISELEAKGEYRDAVHGPIFDAFGENGLDPRDMAAFPDYLVCVDAASLAGAEHDALMEMFAAGLPVKVLVRHDDLFDAPALGDAQVTLALRSRQLATSTIGLGGVFVLQAAVSHLPAASADLARALAWRGPALLSVYSGAAGGRGALPPYLDAAAAMDARVFPAICFDPSAGEDWATRFSVAGNPQPGDDWASQPFGYENEWHQRVTERLAFTAVDFVSADARQARHFARIPRERWNGGMVPVEESIARASRGLPDRVPCVLMVDRDNVLQKAVVDERLVREARRCRDYWRSLQELAGIRSPHAERLLARERSAWEAEREAKAASESAPPAAATPAPRAVPPATSEAGAPAPAAAAAEPERSRDEAWIETPRCSTCNECTTINPRMFAYDANKQAYIADINAGTYAQLVEAAESCQVAIIHPGKPRNPNEPGLDDLLARAEAFR